MDVPGPGTYDIDQYPNSQKLITRCFGTDDRKGLGQPNARDLPGPGAYFVDYKEPPQGPQIAFPLEKKTTKIKKTNDPGPASYFAHPTVGVIAGYNAIENNPRELYIEEATR